MKASESNFLNLLKSTSQFVVPIYQRMYSWDLGECEQLWNDILRAGAHESLGAHFTGSIVYVSRGASTNTAAEPDLIIDGQQRTTTVSLLLTALANRLGELPEGEQEIHDGFSPKKIRDRYLLDENEDGDRRFKLLLSQGDRSTFNAIVQGHELARDSASRVLPNYEFFVDKLKTASSGLVTICKGLEKLVVVDVKLERGVDNPQLVFEAMNSTGKKLSQADLIRNFVLMDLEPQFQTQLYERYWRPMERRFESFDEGQFDAFVRHYLTLKTGEIPRIDDVYDAFKEYALSEQEVGQTVDALVHDLSEYARRYAAMAFGAEHRNDLKLAFDDLEQIKADVVYPFTLELYKDFDEGFISEDEFVRVIHLISSYVFRRAVCKIPTNSLNKTFAGVVSRIDRDAYVESVEAYFLNLQSYRRFPSDDEFKASLESADLYNFRRRMYLLGHLENANRPKEPASVDRYSIEHIMPQNPELSAAWQADLGPDWAEIHERYLHTLGNLTLTGYNSEYSDKPFKSKRDMEGGFAKSPLRLNEGLGQVESWNEGEIKSRAKRLADECLKIWRRPVLAPDQIAKYRTVDSRAQGKYSIDDHPWLTYTPQRQAFYEKLHEALMAIDPVVARHFLKLYVAYKAETNFVDVVPLKSKLGLSINVPVGELVDPRGLARDVSKMGKWGNGAYEVDFDENSDFDYVLGLVRQAFDAQLGDAA